MFQHTGHYVHEFDKISGYKKDTIKNNGSVMDVESHPTAASLRRKTYLFGPNKLNYSPNNYKPGNRKSGISCERLQGRCAVLVINAKQTMESAAFVQLFIPSGYDIVHYLWD